MITISPPQNLSRQMFYNNAIAVFGIIPMYALMVHTEQLTNTNPMLKHEVKHMRTALLEFKDDKKFVEVVQNNMNLFNGTIPVQLTNVVIDAYFKDLGYYEVYDIKNLKRDMENIVKFIDQV